MILAVSKVRRISALCVAALRLHPHLAFYKGFSLFGTYESKGEML